jgi:hypothetical protein
MSNANPKPPTTETPTPRPVPAGSVWPFLLNGWGYRPNHTSYTDLLGCSHQHRSC